jgi:hypothetical protein
MAENRQVSRGQIKDLTFSRGRTPVDPGPYIGIVKDATDVTLSGRLRVYIPEMPGSVDNDPATWHTVSYMSPFYGVTSGNPNADTGPGEFINGRQSYGFWATAPDEGSSVMVIFVYGDPNQGYYIGCIPEPSLTHMIPAIGAAADPDQPSDNNDFYATQGTPSGFVGKPLLPTIEINDYNQSIEQDPKYYTKPKAVHIYQAAQMLQQGLLDDPARGPITTNSQRESPSRVFGISTPGQPIYSGVKGDDVSGQVDSGTVASAQLKVTARTGGHTLAMDDGDINNNNKLFRLRSGQGHQILMNDSDSFLHIISKRGDVWIEFNREGALDIYAENSINLRTAGTLNLHADRDININAEGQIRMRSKGAMNLETQDVFNLRADKNINVYTQATFEVKADGTLLLEAGGKGSWKCGGELRMDASLIALNSGGSETVPVVPELVKNSLPDTEFDGNDWIIQKDVIQTVATRAPTHEPYPMHDYGVDNGE